MIDASAEMESTQAARVNESLGQANLDTEMPQPNCPWGSQAGTAVIGPDGLPIFVESVKPGNGDLAAGAISIDGGSGDLTGGPPRGGQARAGSGSSRRRQAGRVDKGRYTASKYNEQILRSGASYNAQKALDYIELLKGELNKANEEQQYINEDAQAYCSRIAPGLESGTLVTDWEAENQRSAETAVLELPEPGQDGVVLLTEQQKQQLINKLSDLRLSPRALHKLKSKPTTRPRERSPARQGGSTLRRAAGSGTTRSNAGSTTTRSTSASRPRARSPQRRLAESDISTMVTRLSRPSTQANEDSYRRQKKAAGSSFSSKDQQKQSFVNESSREMVSHMTPIQDRSQMTMNKRKAWVEEQQKQQAIQIEASFAKPTISTAASKKKRSVADLMRWQAKKLDNRKANAAQKEKEDLSAQQEPKIFNSRCSEIMSTERLFMGNRNKHEKK